MITKALQLFLLAGLLTVARAGDGHAGWLTDLNAAKEAAKKDGKAILMDFTGSDWCGYCIKLKKAVFDTAEFAKFAEKNLVLVEVDFPRSKKQSKELKRANLALNDQYNIEGYPTIVVLDAAGKELGRMEGYEGENAAEYIKKLQALIAKKAK